MAEASEAGGADVSRRPPRKLRPEAGEASDAEGIGTGGKREASLGGRECAGKRVKHNVAWLGVAQDELSAERDTLLLWAQP